MACAENAQTKIEPGILANAKVRSGRRETKMRKASILVIVGLLAVTGLMAAMAYSDATITNVAGVVSVETNSALLALTPNEGIGRKDNTCYVEDGMLKFNFAAGITNSNMAAPWKGNVSEKDWGLQPGSIYIFEDLFRITNNSREQVKFKISVTGELANFGRVYIGKGVNGLIGKTFTVEEDGDLVPPHVPLHSEMSWYYPGNNWNTINPAVSHINYKDVSIAFVIPADANFTPEDITGAIVVHAWAD
jgi:hypothetical protein